MLRSDRVRRLIGVSTLNVEISARMPFVRPRQTTLLAEFHILSVVRMVVNVGGALRRIWRG